MLTLPDCADGTAYATLLTRHARPPRSTFLSKDASVPLLHLARILLRSLRLVETRCQRDFVLLVGDDFTSAEMSKVYAVAKPNGMRVVPRLPPLLPGTPSADKLHVLRLQLTRVLVLDLDVLVLQSLDSLFDEHQADLTIAHHASDLAQGGACALPLHRRGVGALFALTPSNETFHAVLAHLTEATRYNAYHLQHYSEQTALSCFFANRSRTLPCAYLFDNGLGGWWPGGPQEHHCRVFSSRTLAAATPACVSEPARCEAWSGAAACRAVAAHVQSDECSWAHARQQVHALHYKGAQKPWRGLSTRFCSGLRHGRLRVAFGASADGRTAGRPLGELSARGDIYWHKHTDGKARCASADHNISLTVQYAPASAAQLAALSTRRQRRQAADVRVPRYCCSSSTLMAAEWFRVNNSL